MIETDQFESVFDRERQENSAIETIIQLLLSNTLYSEHTPKLFEQIYAALTIRWYFLWYFSEQKCKILSSYFL